MRQSALYDSESQEWSEPIIVLGKGVPAYSTQYGCLIHCAAGIGEISGWLRLYPFFVERLIRSIQLVEKFDVIRVIYREKRPETIRPESRKIYPESVKKVDHIGDSNMRAKILREHTEHGTFLHDNSWYGKKTLGMIRPIEPRFFLATQGVPKVKFRCHDTCDGHMCVVGELERFDSVGRIVTETANIDLESRLNSLQKGECRFVMGTDSRHPQCWLLISVHAIEASRHEGKEA